MSGGKYARGGKGDPTITNFRIFNSIYFWWKKCAATHIHDVRKVRNLNGIGQNVLLS
jgi:hypothetical protein